MIKGVGIDSVEIQRFAPWHSYSYQKLNRIFSDCEIAYCLSSKNKCAERFAVRFAAKEALLKALCVAGVPLPLLHICKHAEISRDAKKSNPIFMLSQALLGLLPKNTVVHLSLTHTKKYATAFVVIEQS